MRAPVDWDRPDWGGHVHESNTGSHLDAEPTLNAR